MAPIPTSLTSPTSLYSDEESNSNASSSSSSSSSDKKRESRRTRSQLRRNSYSSSDDDSYNIYNFSRRQEQHSSRLIRRRHSNNNDDDSSHSSSSSASCDSSDSSDSLHDSSSSSLDSKYNKGRRQQRSIIKRMSCSSSKLLLLAFLIWMLAQLYCLYSEIHSLGFSTFWQFATYNPNQSLTQPMQPIHHYNQPIHHYSNQHVHVENIESVEHSKLNPANMERLRQERSRESLQALGSAAARRGHSNNSGGKPGKPNKRDSHGSSPLERLAPGCQALPWHHFHFPTCNDIHDIDLAAAIRQTRHINHANFTPWGFVADGLWRDVFSCDPRQETASIIHQQPPAVLKIMKSEHPYDQRNFQRHRRDALVMERLTSSPHIVNIYSHCANSVLTQAISHTLDDVIYAKLHQQTKLWNPDTGYKIKPPLHSWMNQINHQYLATRETPLGRIQLALGVFQALMELHENTSSSSSSSASSPWLPIVHADIQAKQYLVDANTGQIYLNDFNRCRFLVQSITNNNIITNKNKNITIINDSNNNNTLQPCPLYIPTAPGAHRSPEEYDNAPLNEKLDVYSAGNILYGILTGKRPWNDERGKHIKSSILAGERPTIDPSTVLTNLTYTDLQLKQLLDLIYKQDPSQRPTAKQIVLQLEHIYNDYIQTSE